MSRFGTYIGSGVTVRYDFGTTGKKKSTYAQVLFIYFEQTCMRKNKLLILILLLHCYIIYITSVLV